MKAVLDTGVVVAGIFWKSEPHRCLVAFARRKYSLALTEVVFAEYARVAWRLKRREDLTVNPEPWLNFIRDKARFFLPTPLNRPVCRDRKDDPFIECALGSGAGILVSRDEDLLALERPFGIEIMTPRRFLSRLKAVTQAR
ncbi:MAG: putative toxin-antitoxin system toxin component, PIN family [Verrucomicrobia bacterium]|nr:putative toxin-antitoxin system toxin component, PIN family [Verrucomicrobiota bacterium]